LIGAILAATATAAVVVVSLRSDVRESIAAWLRAHNRQASFLMDALLFIDRVGVKYQTRILMRTTDNIWARVENERDYSLDEIDDPELVRQLEEAGRAQKRVLGLLEN
jgi:hypothetical protein